jgi:hypothetical protein
MSEDVGRIENESTNVSNEQHVGEDSSPIEKDSVSSPEMGSDEVKEKEEAKSKEEDNNISLEVSNESQKPSDGAIQRRPNAWKESPVGLTKYEIAIVTFGLMLGLFLASLDQTIVSTALPAIISDFKKLVCIFLISG